MKTENQTALQTYLEKGVTQISVKDGIARPTNPHKKLLFSVKSVIGVPNPDYKKHERTNYPIPCPAIADGVYGIEQLKEEEQYYNPASRKWIKEDDIATSLDFGHPIRTILKLKKSATKIQKRTDLFYLQNELRNQIFIRPYDLDAIESAAIELCDAVCLITK